MSRQILDRCLQGMASIPGPMFLDQRMSSEQVLIQKNLWRSWFGGKFGGSLSGGLFTLVGLG